MQEFEFIAVAINGSSINDVLRYPLVPDYSFVLDVSDLRREHGVFRLATATVGERRGPEPASEFWIRMTSTRILEVGFYGPHPEREPTELGPRRIQFQNYSSPGRGGVEYEAITPYDMVGNDSTDRFLMTMGEIACALPRSAECASATGDALTLQRAHTPDVGFGVAFHRLAAQATTDPDALLGGTDRALPPGSRRGPEDPRVPASLPRTPTPSSDPLPIPVLSGGSAGELPEGVPPSPDPAPRSSRGPIATSPPLDPSIDAPVLAMALAFALAVALSAFYSRIRRGDPALTSGLRATILDLLRAGPKTVTELARETGSDRKTITYHADLLARNELVVIRRAAGHFIVGLPGADVPVPISAERRILALIESNGGRVSRDVLPDRLPGMPTRTRNHAIRMLVASGEVVREWTSEGQFLRRGAAKPATGA